MRAQPGRQRGAGGDLHQLLKAPLQRAFAHAQAHHLRAVAHHLHLDVACTRHQALDVHAAFAERRLRLRGAALPQRRHVFGALHHPHAAAAAAGHRLDDDAARALRHLLGEEGFGLGQRRRVVQARHQRHAAFGRQRAGARLVAEQRQLLRRGADEGQARIGAGLGERRALAQEAVARMHRVAALRAGGDDQRSTIQIRRRAGGLQRDGVVGQLRVQRTRVVLREHGHAGAAQVMQRTSDADGDLAAVGDQDFFQHKRSLTGHGRGPHPNPLPEGEGVKQHAARSSGLTRPRPSAAMARVAFQPPLWPCREAQGVGRARQRSMPRFVL